MSIENILLVEECNTLKEKYESDGWSVVSQKPMLVHGGYTITTICEKDGEMKTFTEDFTFLLE